MDTNVIHGIVGLLLLVAGFYGGKEWGTIKTKLAAFEAAKLAAELPKA